MRKEATGMTEIESGHPHPNPTLTQLFITFLRMGSTAFGGPAMIAYLRRMAVKQKKWLDDETFQDGVALCQTIPGATVMQMAAYIGLTVAGTRAALVSYIGMILPAFLLMLSLAWIYADMQTLPAVVSAFSGLQAVIVAIVANATLSFGKASLKSGRNALIALLAAGLFALKANPVLILLLAAFLGILLKAGRSTALKKTHDDNRSLSPVLFPLFLFVYTAGLALLYFYRRELFHLAVLMTKVDLMAFGGGFASVPLMFHEVVEVRDWMDGPTFLNGMILGQLTPGPIVITATFVGYVVEGFPGALIATVAIFTPSFLILIGVAPWFDRMRSTPWFSPAVGGILCSFVGLLLAVTIRFGLTVHWDMPHGILAATALAALLFKVDLLWVILAGTVVSPFFL